MDDWDEVIEHRLAIAKEMLALAGVEGAQVFATEHNLRIVLPNGKEHRWIAGIPSTQGDVDQMRGAIAGWLFQALKGGE